MFLKMILKLLIATIILRRLQLFQYCFLITTVHDYPLIIREYWDWMKCRLISPPFLVFLKNCFQKVFRCQISHIYDNFIKDSILIFNIFSLKLHCPVGVKPFYEFNVHFITHEQAWSIIY